MKSTIVNIIKNVSHKLGVTLLKNSQFHDIISQRDALLSMYVEAHKPNNRVSTAVVAFSLNRPIQLYATLESYFKYMQNPAHVYVIYAGTTSEYLKGYEGVMSAFENKGVTFVKETRFRDTLIMLLELLKEDSITFMTDDDIFTREYNMKTLQKFEPLEEIVSLRMAPYFTRSYTMNMPQLPPKHLKRSHKHEEMFEWSWQHVESGNEWAYPMSVEFHLFDTAEIKAMTKSLNFKAPNTYEGMLMAYFSHVKGRKGFCYEHQFLFNNPCNKVQKENNNIAGNITPEFLLKKWQDGYKIDINPFHHLLTKAPHEEMSFKFIQR